VPLCDRKTCGHLSLEDADGKGSGVQINASDAKRHVRLLSELLDWYEVLLSCRPAFAKRNSQPMDPEVPRITDISK
jgi:hypothetical protein